MTRRRASVVALSVAALILTVAAAIPQDVARQGAIVAAGLLVVDLLAVLAWMLLVAVRDRRIERKRAAFDAHTDRALRVVDGEGDAR